MPTAIPLNNAVSRLAMDHTSGSGVLVLKPGEGVRFGSPTVDAPIRVTVAARSTLVAGQIAPTSTQTIFLCTARTDDTLSGLTATEGTSDGNYFRNDPIASLITAGTLADIASGGQIVAPAGLLKGPGSLATATPGTDYFSPESIASSIHLTARIFAVVGHEISVYFDNITQSFGPTPIYEVDITSDFGAQMEDRWAYTPLDADVGTHAAAVTFAVTYYDLTVSTHVCDLIVKPALCATTVTRQAVVIGDSTTEPDSPPDAFAGKWLGEAWNLCNSNHTSPIAGGGPDNLTVNFVGNYTSQAQGRDGVSRTIKHSAHGGWSLLTFTGNSASPYWFDGAFSVPKYCIANSITLNAGDWVIFTHGINDVFFSGSDAGAQAAITATLAAYEIMFNGWKSVQPAVRFGVMLPIPPSMSQDAFGTLFGCGFKRSNQKRWIGMLQAALINAFAPRESDNIFLGATYHASVDTLRNFVWDAKATNFGNPTLIGRMVNALHPVSQGQFQMADAVYAFLRGHE